MLLKGEVIAKIFLVITGVVVGVLGGEIFVRVMGAAPQVGAASRDQYRLSPNSRIVYEPVEGYQIGADKTNSLGYRGPVYEMDKPASAFRVVVIGDSVSAGLLIPDYRQTYPAILEDKLRSNNIRTEVMDLGVSGYNTGQEIETLRDKGIGFNPDLILLQYALNDIYTDDDGLARDVIKKAKARKFFERIGDNPLLLNSALYRFLRYRVMNYSLTEHWKQGAKELEEIGKNRIREGFAELREIAADRCVLIAIFPWFERGLDPYPYLEHHARIGLFSDENEFHKIDLLETFRACEIANKGKVNLDHVHPNADGHRCAGEALANHIVNNDLVSRCSRRR